MNARHKMCWIRVNVELKLWNGNYNWLSTQNISSAFCRCSAVVLNSFSCSLFIVICVYYCKNNVFMWHCRINYGKWMPTNAWAFKSGARTANIQTIRMPGVWLYRWLEKRNPKYNGNNVENCLLFWVRWQKFPYTWKVMAWKCFRANTALPNKYVNWIAIRFGGGSRKSIIANIGIEMQSEPRQMRFNFFGKIKITFYVQSDTFCPFLE